MTPTDMLLAIAIVFQAICVFAIILDRRPRTQAPFSREELELIQHAVAERRGTIVRESIDKPSETIDQIVADYRALAEKVAMMLMD